MEKCPHCGFSMFRMSEDGSRLKAPTSCLVLHKSGQVEVNCSRCKQGVLVPLKVDDQQPTVLRKANLLKKRYVVRRGKAT